MSLTEIKVPNIGDFKDVEVIEVLVKEGDEIKKNDPLITIESDKSSVEIPSTIDGKIIKLNCKIGDKVSEGDCILSIENNTKSNDTKPRENWWTRDCITNRRSTSARRPWETITRSSPRV